jgi:hypothetical protein
MSCFACLTFLTLCSLVAGGGEDTKPAGTYAGKVSDLSVPAEKIGDQWTGPTGLVIDDFQKLGDLSDDEKAIAEELKKQVSAIGVIATGDFTYRKKFNPLHQVTLRVFVFDSEQSCRDWWKKKYEYPGWETHYTKVDTVAYSALDSKEAPKRAVSFGNVWVTCGALQMTDDHLKILDLYVRKLNEASSDRK